MMLQKLRIALAATMLALAAVSAADSASASTFGYQNFELPFLFGNSGGVYIGP
jgi:hypothetical protein